jgi:hypothetical protein
MHGKLVEQCNAWQEQWTSLCAEVFLQIRAAMSRVEEEGYTALPPNESYCSLLAGPYTNSVVGTSFRKTPATAERFMQRMQAAQH